MSTLLVIQAYAKDKSTHLDRLNQHFIISYQQAHPKDRIIFHDLINGGTPTLNSQMLMTLRKSNIKSHYQRLNKNCFASMMNGLMILCLLINIFSSLRSNNGSYPRSSNNT